MAELIVPCCMSDEEKIQRSRSKAIDKQLAKEKIHLRRTVKILLLGSGESGKSTFLKQMRIINGRDFQDDELRNFKTIIYGNIIKGMKVLIDAREKLHIPWGDENNVKNAEVVFTYDNNVKLDEAVFLQYVDYMNELWKDSGIKTAFDRRREFQLGDSVEYFFSDLSRIATKNYIPTRQDVLYSRKATKGIHEITMDIRGVPFLFVDVGGQRSQRQKWYQCFDRVTSILFLASSCEFDQVLFEDRRTNRLVESCNIFETIVNNKAFVNVSIILFLNKMDLLEKKVARVNIKDYFPEFSGTNSHDLKQVQAFLLSLFQARRRERSKPMFHHFTTAVDTDNIKVVFTSVRDTILQQNLESIMLQ